MQPTIRLIGLDLDETTLNSKKQITPRVKSAIAAATAAGIAVLPATGRALATLPAEFMQIPGVQYAVCANGAKIYRQPGPELLAEDCFDTATALSLLEDLSRFPCAPSAFVDGAAYSNPVDYTPYVHAGEPGTMQYIISTRKFVPNLQQHLQNSNASVEKISILFQTAAERQAALQLLSQREDCVVTSSMPGNLELNTPTANKGAALLRLGDILGIPHSQIMAVGDGLNDLAMLQAVGWPVAMANAVPQLKQVAKHITASCDEDGVALAIEDVLPR